MFRVVMWLVLSYWVGFGSANASASPDVEELLVAGRIAEALPLARGEAEAEPANLAVQERYIDLLLTVGLAGDAVDTYRARLEAEASADSWYLLGRAVITADEAEAAYRRALELQPDHARADMGLGAVFRARGALDEAIEAYRTALQLDPTLGEAWAGLVAALLGQGRAEEALRAARLAMANVPHEAEPYLTVAGMAPADAGEVLREAVRRVPGDPRVHEALARELLGEARGAEALKEAEVALSIAPGSADALLTSMFAREMVKGALDGEGYRRLVEARAMEASAADGGLEAYRALVEAYPSCSLVFMGRARVRERRGDSQGALEDLGHALMMDPSNIEAMAVMGLLLLKEGRPLEARPLLRRAVEARPTDVSLAIASATAGRDAGERAEALHELGVLEQQHLFDVRIPLTIARFLSEDGQRSAAYAVLRAAVERRPDGRVVLALAAAAKDMGRFEEAADLIDELARRSGKKELRELSKKVRAGALE